MFCLLLIKSNWIWCFNDILGMTNSAIVFICVLNFDRGFFVVVDIPSTEREFRAMEEEMFECFDDIHCV